MSILQELTNVVDSVYTLTGARVCVYDFYNRLTYESGVYKTSFSGHYCDLCSAIRSLQGGRKACVKSDLEDTVQLVREYRRPFFKICHIGLLEYVIPILHQEQILGLIFIGQCRVEEELNLAYFRNSVIKLGGDQQHFTALLDALPKVTKTTLLQAGLLVNLSVQHLMDTSDKSKLGILLQNRPINLSIQALSIIRSSYMLQLSAHDISQRLHVNQSYLARVFKEETGQTIMETLMRTRIEHAKNLVANTKIPFYSIAYDVGYNDQNYFCRHFRRLTGMNPSAYRRLASLTSGEKNTSSPGGHTP